MGFQRMHGMHCAKAGLFVIVRGCYFCLLTRAAQQPRSGKGRTHRSSEVDGWEPTKASSSNIFFDGLGVSRDGRCGASCVEQEVTDLVRSRGLTCEEALAEYAKHRGGEKSSGHTDAVTNTHWCGSCSISGRWPEQEVCLLSKGSEAVQDGTAQRNPGYADDGGIPFSCFSTAKNNNVRGESMRVAWVVSASQVVVSCWTRELRNRFKCETKHREHCKTAERSGVEATYS